MYPERPMARNTIRRRFPTSAAAWPCSTTFHRPPATAVAAQKGDTADGLPAPADGLWPNASPGVRFWMDADLTSVRWRRHAPFNCRCSPGLSVRRQDRRTARRVGLRPSRSSFPALGPADVRPVPAEAFVPPRTMLRYTLQGLRPSESVELDGLNIVDCGGLRAPPRPEGRGIRADGAAL